MSFKYCCPGCLVKGQRREGSGLRVRDLGWFHLRETAKDTYQWKIVLDMTIKYERAQICNRRLKEITFYSWNKSIRVGRSCMEGSGVGRLLSNFERPDFCLGQKWLRDSWPVSDVSVWTRVDKRHWNLRPNTTTRNILEVPRLGHVMSGSRVPTWKNLPEPILVTDNEGHYNTCLGLLDGLPLQFLCLKGQ